MLYRTRAITSLLYYETYEIKELVNYPYETYDFIFGADGKLYFLEANAVGGGIYVLPVMHREFSRFIPDNEIIKNSEAIKSFVKGSIFLHYLKFGEQPKTSIITVPKKRADLLNLERGSIAHYFRAFGIRSWLVPVTKLEFGGQYLYADIDDGRIIPDIIVRRSFNFFMGIKNQTIINPSEVGKITINKWEVYKLVKEVIRKTPELEGFLRVPETVYSESSDLIEKARDMLEKYGKVVVKPNKGHKGEGVIVLRDKKDLDKLEKLSSGKKRGYVIQQLIDSYPFRSYDGNYYAFDLRVYGFLGRIIGIEGRRAPKPLNTDRNESNTVCNISAGGTLIYTTALENQRSMIEFINAFPFKIKLSDYEVKVDGRILSFNMEFLKKLSLAILKISQEISRAVERL